jgi:hypothetical protein
MRVPGPAVEFNEVSARLKMPLAPTMVFGFGLRNESNEEISFDMVGKNPVDDAGSVGRG